MQQTKTNPMFWRFESPSAIRIYSAYCSVLDRRITPQMIKEAGYPESWFVEWCQGEFYVDKRKVELLHLGSFIQKDHCDILDPSVFGSRFLLPSIFYDALLANQHLIPRKWFQSQICFFGSFCHFPIAYTSVPMLFFGRDWNGYFTWRGCFEGINACWGEKHRITCLVD